MKELYNFDFENHKPVGKYAQELMNILQTKSEAYIEQFMTNFWATFDKESDSKNESSLDFAFQISVQEAIANIEATERVLKALEEEERGDQT